MNDMNMIMILLLCAHINLYFIVGHDDAPLNTITMEHEENILDKSIIGKRKPLPVLA